MEASLKELSNYRLEKARRNLAVAENLAESEYYDAAVNRAYYAAFDAMRAVNALDGFDSSKHSGVIAHFNQFYVKEGKFKPETSAVIRRAAYTVRSAACGNTLRGEIREEESECFYGGFGRCRVRHRGGCIL